MYWFDTGFDVVMFLLGAGAAIGLCSQRVVRAFSKRKKSKHRYDLSHSQLVDSAVQRLVEELLQRTGAMRVHTHRFHNGADFFDGSAMKRSSCTCAAAAPGVSREVSAFQQIPLSLFADWQRMLLTNLPYLHRVSDMTKGHYRAQLEDLGVKAVCVMPLTINKLIVGAVCVHYSSETCEGHVKGCKWYGEPCTGDRTSCALVKHYAALVEIELSKCL